MEARYHYERWGARAKAEQLASQFPELELLVTGQPGVTTRSAVTQGRTSAGTTSSEDGIDLLSAMRAAQAIAGELVLERLVERLLRILLENAGAQRGCLLLNDAGQLCVIAALNVDPDCVEIGLAEPLGSSTRVAASVVQFVARMKEPVVLDDASKAQRFVRDEYLQTHGTRSLACLPLLHQGELSAILYLENAAVAGAFTAGRVQRLQFLGSHAAVAIDNAKLYGQVQAATRRLEEANDTLEQKVRGRTRELQGRNEDMRRVLDNVAQGLISVDLSGRMASERSAVVARWFGELAVGASFEEAMQPIDPKFASWFGFNLSMVADDILPTEVALEQMPRRLVHGAREYGVSYSPIRSGATLTGVLIVIDDATDAVQLARAEADQKEQLALFRGLAQDRSAVAGFFEEGAELVAKLRAPAADAAVSKRALHTLKGNAGMHGLSLLAGRCHDAEDAIAEGAATAEALAPVFDRWGQLLRTRDLLLGERAGDVLEIERSALAALLERASAGVSARELASELELWTLESLNKPLLRLGEHAKSLSSRLGKAPAEVLIADAEVLAEPSRTRTLWAVLVHMVRNAVDHGFETELERSQRGKPDHNQFQLSARLEQRDVVIEIVDDGHGIDWDRVRELAEERGIPCASREDLLAVLLTPSVSTRSEVSATSGRGEGLAAVQRDVEALGGQLTVESETGSGAAWTIRVPAAALGARRAPAASSPADRSSSRASAPHAHIG
jgi:GAF domain-containing protein/HPt (histidine-containing phosphotransfer) domain-containing protein